MLGFTPQISLSDSMLARARAHPRFGPPDSDIYGYTRKIGRNRDIYGYTHYYFLKNVFFVFALKSLRLRMYERKA